MQRGSERCSKRLARAARTCAYKRALRNCSLAAAAAVASVDGCVRCVERPVCVSHQRETPRSCAHTRTAAHGGRVLLLPVSWLFYIFAISRYARLRDAAARRITRTHVTYIYVRGESRDRGGRQGARAETQLARGFLPAVLSNAGRSLAPLRRA